VGFILGGLAVLAVVGAAPAGAVPPDPAEPGDGRQWRQLYETAGLSWSSVAGVCPQDGVTPCSGSIGGKVVSGWVWATADQVRDFLGLYEPALLTAEPPSVSGESFLGSAIAFLEDMRETGHIVTYTSSTTWAAGWTASADENGLPIEGRVGWGYPPPGGGFSVSAVAVDPMPWTRGVFLWRPSGFDYTPPTITPTVAGTLGTNGWYVSDASVSWTVEDPESEVVSQVGCDPSAVTVDTVGTSFTCEATSETATATASVIVTRDTTPPVVTCPSPAPVFQIYQLGAWVTAAVADATSGPLRTYAQGTAVTGTPGSFLATVTGTDRAGHHTTTQCPYQVVIPTCNGLAATRVGTAVNDTVNGTSGSDVIVALGGLDRVYGLGGDDVICGGDGPDTIDGGDGHDWVDGGASPDDLLGGYGNDYLDGGLHNDSIRGGNGTDTCVSGEVRMSSCEL
jgi:Ca2+-binding RTX toxin-like protein